MSRTASFSPQHLLTSLRSSLEVLRESPDHQLRYLESLGVPDQIDELALELDDLIPNIMRLAESQLISSEGAASIRQLDEALTAMSGSDNKALWTPWALRTAPDWSEIRVLASRALSFIEPVRSSAESA